MSSSLSKRGVIGRLCGRIVLLALLPRALQRPLDPCACELRATDSSPTRCAAFRSRGQACRSAHPFSRIARPSAAPERQPVSRRFRPAPSGSSDLALPRPVRACVLPRSRPSALLVALYPVLQARENMATQQKAHPLASAPELRDDRNLSRVISLLTPAVRHPRPAPSRRWLLPWLCGFLPHAWREARSASGASRRAWPRCPAVRRRRCRHHRPDGNRRG